MSVFKHGDRRHPIRQVIDRMVKMYDEAEETLRVLGQCAAQESDEKNAARVAAYGVITHVTGANCAFDRDLSGNLTPRGREGRMIYLLRARKNLREMRRKLECTSLAVA